MATIEWLGWDDDGRQVHKTHYAGTIDGPKAIVRMDHVAENCDPMIEALQRQRDEERERQKQEPPRPMRRDMDGALRNIDPKIGRNDVCQCGSGLKFKKCHGKTS